MPRPRLHSTEQILDAARTLVLERGARAATIDRIATASGASKGAIYHRFASADDLLAAMWLRAVRRAQAGVLAAIARDGDAIEAAVAAGLSVHDFARVESGDARLLAALRREDLIARTSDPALARDLDAVNDDLRDALAALAGRLDGRASRAAVERVACAVVDLPQGAIRRHLIAGSPLPAGLRARLEAAIRAALAVADRAPPSRGDQDVG